jgi:hypothetical protein
MCGHHFQTLLELANEYLLFPRCDESFDSKPSDGFSIRVNLSWNGRFKLEEGIVLLLLVSILLLLFMMFFLRRNWFCFYTIPWKIFFYILSFKSQDFYVI